MSYDAHMKYLEGDITKCIFAFVIKLKEYYNVLNIHKLQFYSNGLCANLLLRMKTLFAT